MGARTWTLSKDTTTAGGSVDLGNGHEQHAPIGYWSGYIYRHFAKYNVDTTGMGSILTATLHAKSTGQTHVAFGSSPTVVTQRVSSNWSGSGGSEGSWSGSANPKSSTQPSVAGGTVTSGMSTHERDWQTIDVTAIAQAWLAGSPNYGIRFKSSNEGSTSPTWEMYAGDSSYDSYIYVTYTTAFESHTPVALITHPEVGDVADMYYTAGSGWASPRPKLSWSINDPDGPSDFQSARQVLVYNDSGGVPGSTLYDSGKDISNTQDVMPAATFVQGNYYHWKVRVWDEADNVSVYTPTERFRAVWGAAEYYGNMGSTPISWSVSELNTLGAVVVEYNSSTNAADPGGSLGTWMPDIASVTKRQYVRYRVWLLPQNAVAPVLNKIVVSYSSATAPTLDGWVITGTGSITTETQVYGTRSLRLEPAAYATQTVPVEPDTRYQFSGRIKQAVVDGLSGILLKTSTGAVVLTVSASPTAGGWTAVGGEWDSGSATSIIVVCDNAAGGGTTWFDALKLEASGQPTFWQPALLSAAVVVDGGGVQIDASRGASLRIRGGSGGVRDLVEADAHGLLIGGDISINSPFAKQLSMGDTSILAGGTSFPTSPQTNSRYWRTDLGMEFYYNGTQWVTTTLYELTIPYVSNQSVSQDDLSPTPTPGFRGGSDIWLVYGNCSGFYVNGGTALSGSHKWDIRIDTLAPGGGRTQWATFAVNSGASNTWRGGFPVYNINALMGSQVYMYIDASKTGTPGNITFFTSLSYRVVAT